MAADSSSGQSGREPTLGDVIRDFWRAKFYLLAGALLGLAAAGLFMAAAIPHYRATMLVGPAERSGGPDIQALLPENSTFAVQYLVNSLGSADSTDFVRFENILRGPSVAALLLDDPRVIEKIERDRAFSLSSAPRIETPEDLAVYLEKNIAVEPVGTSPLRKLVYLHPDRAFAAYLLQRLYKSADGLIRDEIRRKTENRAAYLEEVLHKVSHPDHREALTSLLMEQEHIQMILAMGEAFAANVAEPPTAVNKPYWPRPSLIFPGFILTGMILAYVLYNLRRPTPL